MLHQPGPAALTQACRGAEMVSADGRKSLLHNHLVERGNHRKAHN